MIKLSLPGLGDRSLSHQQEGRISRQLPKHSLSQGPPHKYKYAQEIHAQIQQGRDVNTVWCLSGGAISKPHQIHCHIIMNKTYNIDTRSIQFKCPSIENALVETDHISSLI